MIRQVFVTLVSLLKAALALLGFTAKTALEVTASMEKASTTLLEETRQQRKAKQENKNV